MSLIDTKKGKSMKAFVVFMAVLLLLQLCASLFLFSDRFAAESKDRDYTIICDAELFKLLPDKSALTEMGVSAVTVPMDDGCAPNMELCSEVTEAGLAVVPYIAEEAVQPSDFFDTCNAYDCKLLISEPAGFSADCDELLDEQGFTLVLRETENQLGNEEISGIDPAAHLASSARMFYLADEYRERYSYIGYDNGEEIGNIFYRAVTERQIRVLLLRSFIGSDGSEVSSAEAYENMLSALQSRLAEKGYQLCDMPSLPGSYDLSAKMPLARILFIASALAILVFLLYTLLPVFGSTAGGLLWLLAFAASLLLYKMNVKYFTMASVFLTAVSMSCLLQYLFVWCAGRISGKSGVGSLALSAVLPLPIILVGGCVVSASMYGLSYKLELDYFVGVKLSMLLPIVYAAALYIRREILDRPREERVFSKQFLSAHKTLIVILVIILALSAAYYVLRIGDSALVGSLELRARNWLESALYARPRTKEILIGYPAFFLALWLAKRENPLSAVAAVFSSILAASAMNTFCHSRAPLAISCARSAGSFLCGALAGIVLILIVFLLIKAFSDRTKRLQ